MDQNQGDMLTQDSRPHDGRHRQKQHQNHGRSRIRTVWMRFKTCLERGRSPISARLHDIALAIGIGILCLLVPVAFIILICCII